MAEKGMRKDGWPYLCLEFCFLHLDDCTVQDLLTLGVKKELSVFQCLMVWTTSEATGRESSRHLLLLVLTMNIHVVESHKQT